MLILVLQQHILSVCYLLLRDMRLMRAAEEAERREAAAVARRRRKKRRAFWVRPWLLRRPEYGQFEKLMKELQMEDLPAFRNFVRVPPALFLELLEHVGPRIQKEDTKFRKALPAGLKLAVTLRYLATGNSYRSLQYGFRVAFNTISKFIPEVCQAIIDEYFRQVVYCPNTPEGWKEVAEGFQSRWNFPHCIGALDGKHVAIRCPPNTGSVYFNYKGYYSLVLMALVDANYQFLYVDVGANGGGSDGGVFSRTTLRTHLDNDTLGLPPPDPLPNDDKDFPYFIAGDEAFPLRSWLMKPIPRRNLTRKQRIFNYRLSRARRVVENAFGILAGRFRCLLTTMPQPTETVVTITTACVTLHNLIKKRFPAPGDNLMMDQEHPETHAIIPGAWRDNAQMDDMGDIARGNVATRTAKDQRLYLVEYVNSEAGSVPWQDDMI